MNEMIVISNLTDEVEKLHNKSYTLGDDTFYPVEIHLLTLIKEQEDVGVAILSQVLNVSKSAVSQKIKRLLEKGYLVLNEKSGRRKTYTLTSKGLKICIYHDRVGSALVNELKRNFEKYSPDERALVTKVLSDITKTLREFDIESEIRRAVEDAD